MKINFFNPRLTYLTIGVVCMLSLIALSSCEKDTLETSTETEQTNGTVNFRNTGDGEIDYAVAESILSGINYDAISINDELETLQFATDEDLQQTLELLEQADLALEAEIIASIEGLPEDEVDQMEILDDFAFETFESNFPGFTSFRSYASAQIEAFFAHEELNDEEDPTDELSVIPDMLGAVLNVHGEVVSSDGAEFEQQVHILHLDGGNYTVLDGDIATVMNIRRDMEHDVIAELPNVQVVDEPEFSRGCCRANKTRSQYKYIYQSGSKKYRAHISVQIRNISFLWINIHRATSQLKSRKKSGWWWKKHYTTITINQQGNVYPSTYYTAPCTKYYYDEDLQQWVPYESTCTFEIQCDGNALSAAASGSGWAWDYSRVRNYSLKVSASDQDGYAGTLRGHFTWKGQSYTLTIC